MKFIGQSTIMNINFVNLWIREAMLWSLSPIFVPLSSYNVNWMMSSQDGLGARTVNSQLKGLLSYASWYRPRNPSLLVRLGLWLLGIPQRPFSLSYKLTPYCVKPKNKQTNKCQLNDCMMKFIDKFDEIHRSINVHDTGLSEPQVHGNDPPDFGR